MGLDCGRGMFLGKHVLSFTKPKVLGEKIASDNWQPKNIVRVIHREFNPNYGLLEVLKPCGMVPDELVPLTTYSLLRWEQPAAKLRQGKAKLTECKLIN